jgi:hypothetical protein
MIKSRRMRWAVRVAHMREMRNVYKKFWLERDHLEVLGIDGRIILKWIVGKYGWRV